MGAVLRYITPNRNRSSRPSRITQRTGISVDTQAQVQGIIRSMVLPLHSSSSQADLGVSALPRLCSSAVVAHLGYQTVILLLPLVMLGAMVEVVVDRHLLCNPQTVDPQQHLRSHINFRPRPRHM